LRTEKRTSRGTFSRRRRENDPLRQGENQQPESMCWGHGSDQSRSPIDGSGDSRGKHAKKEEKGPKITQVKMQCNEILKMQGSAGSRWNQAKRLEAGLEGRFSEKAGCVCKRHTEHGEAHRSKGQASTLILRPQGSLRDGGEGPRERGTAKKKKKKKRKRKT